MDKPEIIKKLKIFSKDPDLAQSIAVTRTPNNISLLGIIKLYASIQEMKKRITTNNQYAHSISDCTNAYSKPPTTTNTEPKLQIHFAFSDCSSLIFSESKAGLKKLK